MAIQPSVRDAARRIIREFCRDAPDNLIEYAQLSRRLADVGIDWIDARSDQMNELLGAIYDFEVPEGSGPEVASCTALVVLKDRRVPGTGYWRAVDRRRKRTVRGPDVPPSEEDLAWWQDERDQAVADLGAPGPERRG